MAEYLLVIDCGGTNTKAVIFDLKGRQMGAASFSTPRLEPEKDYREINLEQLWQVVCEAIKVVLVDSGVKAADIIGMTTVGHGKGLYVIDQMGSAVRDGILSTDNRGIEVLAALDKQAEAISRLSLQPLIACQAPVLLRWLKENEPENYLKIDSIFSVKDFIRFKLTGVRVAEYTDSSGNNLLNLRTRNYDAELLELFGIEEMKACLPPLKKFDEICGYTTAEVTEKTGIVTGTPVCSGMFDINACAIGTNVLDERFISMIAGTWSINEYPAKEPTVLTEGLTNSLFCDGEHYLIESSSATSAGNLDLILEKLMQDEIKMAKDNGLSIFDSCEEWLAHSSAVTTAIIYLPFLYGSNVHPYAKASFIGLDSQSTKSEMIRAVYEGIVFSHKYHLEKLLVNKKVKPLAIRLSGGVVQSKNWIQLFADILGYPIEIVEAKELGALGGAIGLALSLGKYPNLQTASQKMTTIQQKVLPNKADYQIYQAKYAVYQKIIRGLESVWTDLEVMSNQKE